MRGALIVLLCVMALLAAGCKPNKEQQPAEEENRFAWKDTQKKLVTDLLSDYLQNKPVDKYYCDAKSKLPPLTVRSWKIIDDKFVSQQVGKYNVRLEYTSSTGQAESQVWLITLFRKDEFTDEYCVDNVAEAKEEAKTGQ